MKALRAALGYLCLQGTRAARPQQRRALPVPFWLRRGARGDAPRHGAVCVGWGGGVIPLPPPPRSRCPCPPPHEARGRLGPLRAGRGGPPRAAPRPPLPAPPAGPLPPSPLPPPRTGALGGAGSVRAAASARRVRLLGARAARLGGPPRRSRGEATPAQVSGAAGRGVRRRGGRARGPSAAPPPPLSSAAAGWGRTREGGRRRPGPAAEGPPRAARKWRKTKCRPGREGGGEGRRAAAARARWDGACPPPHGAAGGGRRSGGGGPAAPLSPRRAPPRGRLSPPSAAHGPGSAPRVGRSRALSLAEAPSPGPAFLRLGVWEPGPLRGCRPVACPLGAGVKNWGKPQPLTEMSSGRTARCCSC
ncbi:hypothetical protein LUU34_01150900 [Aix galericulata]|nr:hypothetical protein LUU34_01150900 [Aix galericulata]